MSRDDFGFFEQLDQSRDGEVTKRIRSVLFQAFPDVASVREASLEADLHGVDIEVSLQNGQRIGVDVKVRDVDPIFDPRIRSDDLALETDSVIGGKIGWTLDVNKLTDYVLWFFKPTGRWVLMPFRMLCMVFIENQEEWCMKYRTAVQTTEGRYRSRCVFVPRREVWAAIYRRFGGSNET